MQTAVYLPNLELNMDNVRVASVRVNVGDLVTQDEVLMEIETEKAVQSVPSPQAGFVRKLYVRSEDRLPANALVCLITDTADEDYEDPAALASKGPPHRVQAASNEIAPSHSSSGSAVKAAPAARKRAKELGLDLGLIIGSGPDGRITVEDVEKAKEKQNLDSATFE